MDIVEALASEADITVHETRSSSLRHKHRDRCRVSLPHCGSHFEFDVILSASRPEQPPDFVLPDEKDDSEFSLDLAALPAYDPADRGSLARIIREIRELYARRQRERAIEAARANPELVFSMEAHLAHVPARSSRLRGADGAAAAPEWAAEVPLPAWGSLSTASLEYVPRVAEALEAAAAALRAGSEQRRALAEALAATLPCTGLLEHGPRWGRAALLSQRTLPPGGGPKETVLFVTHLVFSPKHPMPEGPAVTVTAAGGRMAAGPPPHRRPAPVVRSFAGKDVPFSPRWNANLLAAKLAGWLEGTAFPQVCKAYAEAE
eukprot:tig00020961_g16726.t1